MKIADETVQLCLSAGHKQGWLYFNEDTGTEYSADHPVMSGACPDAQNVRPATAENLLVELLSSWKAWAEDRQETMDLRDKLTAKSIDVAAVRRQAFDEALDAVGRVKDNFMSEEYATPQPMGSLHERFACDAVIEAIRALSAEPAQGEQWQPIETCPARHVLFYGKTAHDKDVIFEGWKSKSGLLYAGDSRNPVSPTHWMSLPAAPNSEAQP